MRKPDGVSVEQALGARASLSYTPSANPSEAAQAHVGSTSPTASPTKVSKRALTHMNGPRRKSTLPRSGSAKVPSTPSGDGDSEGEEVDLEQLKGLDLSDDEYVPQHSQAIPANAGEAKATETRETKEAKENKAVRTSPRKPVKVARPLSSNVRLPSLAARAALKDRGFDNGQAGTGSDGVTKVAAGARRPAPGLANSIRRVSPSS